MKQNQEPLNKPSCIAYRQLVFVKGTKNPHWRKVSSKKLYWENWMFTGGKNMYVDPYIGPFTKVN